MASIGEASGPFIALKHAGWPSPSQLQTMAMTGCIGAGESARFSMREKATGEFRLLNQGMWHLLFKAWGLKVIPAVLRCAT